MRYSSSDLSNMANVTKKTLRHYEKMEILIPSLIDSNGYWYYTDEDLDKLQLIKNLQTMGFSLKEIKTNLDTDCQLLRELLSEKLNYINEQMLQLELAKRMIKKINSSTELSVYDAIKVSLDEEHLLWYKENLPEDQYHLVLDMMNKPESLDDHNTIIEIIKSTKPLIKKKNPLLLGEKIQEISLIFKKYHLTDNTVELLVESFLKSNLEGPLSLRILNVKEVVYLLEIFRKLGNC
ncbi:MAG: MerR family transcriptional regulator [Clostridia bacterium]|nr:MerR family transcriptional regulator [Clostridia bacterium]